MHSELNRRLGAARTDFKTLGRVWNRSCITPQRKIQIFDASLVRNSYTVCTLELRKLDGFHARCLRTILGIPHSFVSMVSNCDVFNAASCWPYLKTLTLGQLMLFQKVAMLPSSDVMRMCVFERGTVTFVFHPRAFFPASPARSQCKLRGGSGARLHAGRRLQRGGVVT